MVLKPRCQNLREGYDIRRDLKPTWTYVSSWIHSNSFLRWNSGFYVSTPPLWGGCTWALLSMVLVVKNTKSNSPLNLNFLWSIYQLLHSTFYLTQSCPLDWYEVLLENESLPLGNLLGNFVGDLGGAYFVRFFTMINCYMKMRW